MSHSTTTQIEHEALLPAEQQALAELEGLHQREAAELARLDSLARLMDARFKIPFLPLPIGMDTIVGLIPVVGDTLTLGVSALIVFRARQLGVPMMVLMQMVLNLLIDWAIGLVPIIGDLFDIGWQGNIRNVRLARQSLDVRWTREISAVTVQ